MPLLKSGLKPKTGMPEAADLKGFSMPAPAVPAAAAVKAGLLGLLVLIPYYSSITYLWGLWKNEDYNYCYLLPLVVLYLIWDKRHVLARLKTVPTWKGLPLVVAALGLFFIGELGGEYYSIHISLWLLIIGLCWMLAGSAKLRVIAFPLGLLLAAIPFPWIIYANLTLRLKLISSQLGVWVLHLCGFSAYREGNVIDLGFTQLQVVDACSGLRYLLPLFVLSIIMVYFYRVSIWKRVVVVLSTVPLTAFTNSLRIALTGILYKHWGAAAADGFFHGFSGWFIFMFAFAALALEMWIINLIIPGRVKEETPQPQTAPPVDSKVEQTQFALNRLLRPPQYAAALAVLALTAAVACGIEFREKIPASRPFTQFPLQVNSWTGSRQYLDAFFIKELDLTDYVIADYQNAGRQVNFYIAYYESQRKGESIHSPDSCLPGSGWIFTRAGKADIPLGNGRTLPVNRAVMEKSGFRQAAYYWFPMRGRVLTSAWEIKFYTFWDALTRRRTDGALVRVITPLRSSETVEDAEARLQEFVREIAPVIDGFVPGK